MKNRIKLYRIIWEYRIDDLYMFGASDYSKNLRLLKGKLRYYKTIYQSSMVFFIEEFFIELRKEGNLIHVRKDFRKYW